MQISQYDYQLPPELIAQFPMENRSASRLLEIRSSGQFEDKQFKDLVGLVQPDDLIVVNDTQVLPARIFGRKPTGGKIQIMLERILDEHRALVLLGSNKPIQIGQKILVDDIVIDVIARHGQFFELFFGHDVPAMDCFRDHGAMPLPPYIDRDVSDLDSERYQTVFSQHPGAVAAPTAGLHFDKDLIAELKLKGVQWGTVTLHVGSGTFQPVRTENIESHTMHSERFEVGEEICRKILQTKENNGRVIAVGTTVVRALETAARSGKLVPTSSDSELFILPGFKFNVIDMLITNFHLPKSTLLMLVSAFAGYDLTFSAYAHAIENQYRFYSYGDAMIVGRQG